MQNQIEMRMHLEFEQIDQKNLSVQILANNQIVHQCNNDLKQVVEFSMSIPGTVELVTSGKGSADTVVGPNNEILQDKHVKVTKVIVDKMPIKTWILEKHVFECFPNDRNQSWRTNYIGHNGSTRMQIESKTGFEFMLHLLSLS
jgi:hypothetical protein